MTALSGTVVATCALLQVVGVVVFVVGMATRSGAVVILALIPSSVGLAPIVDEVVGVSRTLATLLMAARAKFAGGDAP